MTQSINIRDTPELQGAAALSKKLNQLKEAARAKALRNAANYATQPLVKKARQLAPQGQAGHKTYKGRLVAPGFGSRSVVKSSKVSRDKYQVAVSVGVKKEAFYMVNFVQLGVSARGIPARPWLTTSYDQTYKQVIGLLTKRLKVNVDKAAKS